MSILTRHEIQQKINNNQLIIEPALDEYQMQPTSIDLRIGWSFYIPYTWKFTDKGRVAVVADYMDYSTTHENFQLIKLKAGQYFEILPGEMILASSLEKVGMSGKLCGVLHARSSASRRGLSIESGLVNPHYSGQLTIPIINQSHHVLKIYPGERLCQMIIHELQTDTSTEEAEKHGLDASKYDQTTPYGLTSKLDSHAEIDILKIGNLDELKKKTITPTPEIEPNTKVEYPYLPADRHFKFVDLNNPWMIEARKAAEERVACSWWPTGAVLVKDNQLIGRGSNAGRFVPLCPRYKNNCPTGTGYELCKNDCLQTSHAEVSSIDDAIALNHNPEGADLYLFGHWWACGDCWSHIIDAKIKNVFLVQDAHLIFTREKRVALMKTIEARLTNNEVIQPVDIHWEI